jgi:hypothetical protein
MLERATYIARLCEIYKTALDLLSMMCSLNNPTMIDK